MPSAVSPLSLSFSLSLPSSLSLGSASSLAWDQPMFLFVQARIATDDERARCPFLAIYIKYRFLWLSGKISASHEYSRTSHPLFPFAPHRRRSVSLQPLAFVKPARLGLTNGTTKEKSLFSRLCPISRLHPSFPYASSPPPLRPQGGPV